MASNNEDSQVALEQIETLLEKLNDDHVWDLIDFLRDKCQVIIPVWFTVPLVQEITEESLGITLNKEQAEEVVSNVNNSDSSYTIGRNLVECMIKYNLPDDCENKEKDTDASESEEEHNSSDEDEK